MTPSDAELTQETRRETLIHREILQIAALMLVAIVGFFLTRAVAASNRDMTFRDAEAWFDRGQQQMMAGRLDDAIESLRRAAVRNRYERRYALALAQALARRNDTEAAGTALFTLREATPEDADINLALARLAARRDDVTEALRFYHNALYAPWPAESADARRLVRFELIEFLLRHDQASRALSELLAVTSDLPDDPATHVRVGQLFARGGDHRHALEQFERALRVAPGDESALAGAGTSAFQLGHYQLARTYLRRAPDNIDDVVRTRQVVELVLAADPLASRIGAAERRRRLAANVEYLQQRLADCVSSRSQPGSDDESELQRQGKAFQEQLSRRTALDQDDVETGVDLFDRVERHLARVCGPPTARDLALTLIAQQHASDAR